jgi:hypothetical protein
VATVCGQVHGPSQPGQLSPQKDLPGWVVACQGSEHHGINPSAASAVEGRLRSKLHFPPRGTNHMGRAQGVGQLVGPNRLQP